MTVPLDPIVVAPDTFLIPNLVPAGDLFLPVNSMVIRGPEPVIVDTAAPVHRDQWCERVLGLVEPEDIRWIFLSHEDSDHTGSLDQVLEAAPNATFVFNAFGADRLAMERTLPTHRPLWLEPGESFRARDRRLQLVRPPIFDGPATSGLFDERTGVMSAVDAFAALTPGHVHHVADLPTDLYEETFIRLNSLVSPSHRWLDPHRYHQHLATLTSRPDRHHVRTRTDPDRRLHPRSLRARACTRRSGTRPVTLASGACRPRRLHLAAISMNAGEPNPRRGILIAG